MLNNKTILTVSITLMFLGLAIAPVNAGLLQIRQEQRPLKCVLFKEDGTLSEEILKLSKLNDAQIEQQIIELIQKLASVSTYGKALQTIKDLFDGSSSDGILKEQFKSISNLRPMKKRVFVISFGKKSSIGPLSKSGNQLNSLQSSTQFWYYPGRSNRKIVDKTIIIDPYPFNVKVIDGRQIGMMRRFMGLYLNSPGFLSDDGYTFFIGYAYKVIGLDLSPFSGK